MPPHPASEETVPDRQASTRPVVRMRRATAADVDVLAPTFATNLAYFQASGEVECAAVAVPDSLVRDHLDVELARRDGRCLVLSDAEGAVVGTACLLVTHPREPYPWIGLLLIDGRRQGEGLGSVAAEALEAVLADEGWPEVRLAVLDANAPALAFWTRGGYRAYARGTDGDGRPCTLLSKPLSGGQIP